MYTFLEKNDKMLIDYLVKENKIPLLEHILKSPMREGVRAGIGVAFGLISKATLFTQEMGIGKTFLAMGLIEGILRMDWSKKVIFCGTNDKLSEYYNLFRENLSPEWGIAVTTAGQSDVMQSFKQLDSDARILICTHSVWDKGYEFHKQLIPRLDQFQCFILDEGGMLLKNSDNYAYRMMVEFVPKMKYRYILNATPIEKDLALLINQCRVLGIPIPSKGRLYAQYGNIGEDEYKWIFGNLKELSEQLKYHVFNVSRKHVESAGKINYILDTKLLRVTKFLSEYMREDNVRSVRFPFLYPEAFTPEIYPSLRTLLKVCTEGVSQGDKLLVYVRNVEPKKYMKWYLEQMGLRVGIYDGSHTVTKEQKDYVEEMFNQGQYDVLLTNKIYGLSLKTANHVVMYDLPPNFYQYIYRAIRDLNDKDLKVTPIIYDFENDYETIKEELNSERYQNEFSDRGFDLVNQIYKQLQHKVRNKLYD